MQSVDGFVVFSLSNKLLSKQWGYCIERAELIQIYIGDMLTVSVTGTFSDWVYTPKRVSHTVYTWLCLLWFISVHCRGIIRTTRCHRQLERLFTSCFMLTSKKPLLALRERNHWRLVDSPHKGTVMWKVFTYHGVIMGKCVPEKDLLKSVIQHQIYHGETKCSRVCWGYVWEYIL